MCSNPHEVYFLFIFFLADVTPFLHPADLNLLLFALGVSVSDFTLAEFIPFVPAHVPPTHVSLPTYLRINIYLCTITIATCFSTLNLQTPVTDRRSLWLSRGQARWGTSQIYVVSHNLIVAVPLCRSCHIIYDF